MSGQIRPFKVWSSDRTIKKSVTASSLRELIEKGCAKLGLEEASHVVLEEDGTEVDDEDYFSFLPINSTLMFLKSQEHWQPKGKEAVALDEPDHGRSHGEVDSAVLLLTSDIKKDMSRIITFSNDQLQQLVDLSTPALAQYLGETERFAQSLQDACQRHLDERAQATETVDLLRLYHKAHQDSRLQQNSSNLKRKAPADDE